MISYPIWIHDGMHSTFAALLLTNSDLNETFLTKLVVFRSLKTLIRFALGSIFKGKDTYSFSHLCMILFSFMVAPHLCTYTYSFIFYQ